MKKVYLLIMIGLVTFSLLGCKKNETTTTKEIVTVKNTVKPITGIDPIFIEELGYNNKFASAMRVSDTKQYVYYSRNSVKFNNITDSIVVREANLIDGVWIYEDFKEVLSLSDSIWDSVHISSPDVIKGRFKYNDVDYSYLMVYSGSSFENGMNSEIGFAVSNKPDGEFLRVGTIPILTFDKFEFNKTGLQDFKGCQEPSLVSYDKKGKVQLFYSHYAIYNSSYCIELDCSNLNKIVRGGRMLSEISGLTDSTNNTHLYSADWAYDSIKNEFVACRNFSSKVSGLPNIAEAVQVVHASVDAIYEVDYEKSIQEDGTGDCWSLINDSYYKIGAVKTADIITDNKEKWSGYYRVFNGTIVSDEYGWMLSDSNVEIIFTSSALDNSMYLDGDEYLFSQMLHSFIIEIDESSSK